ncbi:TIGR02594 family protein [Rhizobium leguminosarum]|uniref:TIGR02594 family protein n=1 Tax=Rhizobium leguminosarum TaxID=384 RepID=UPI000DE4C698|nr:TIGR02594 family protein [Rhizobium leguminosarum]TCA08576.1 TIGR02594 family protein [Rhizobium leguminosarum bv. viciae]
MDYDTVSTPVVLRINPSKTSPEVMDGSDPVMIFESASLVAIEVVDGTWSKVTVDTGGGVGFTGHIQRKHIAHVTYTPIDIAQKDFAQLCASACSSLLVDLGFMFALARTESREFWADDVIHAEVYRYTGASGPFQFIPSTWEGLVRQVGSALGIRLIDSVFPAKQAVLAAYTIRDAIGRHQIAFGTVPSPAVLYLYHLFGWPAATKILAGGENERVDDLLRLAGVSGEIVQKIMDGNSSLLKTSGGTSRTIAGVLDEAAGRLQQSYQENAQLLTDAPDWWPLHIGQAAEDAPWLDRAREELGQTEVPGNPSNPHIVEYLKAVGFGSDARDETPWCAGFVAWCIINSGNQQAAGVAQSLPNRSFASAWLNLENVLPSPAIGAIGITKAYSRDTTGHVGFVSEVRDDGVMILGGNQRPPTGGESICVSERFFPSSDFVGFRWPV